MLAALPRELLLSIFKHLDDDSNKKSNLTNSNNSSQHKTNSSHDSLLNVALVCRSLASAARDSLLWESRCRRQHYVPIGYSADNIELSEDYWDEFCYQKQVDRAVARLLNEVVNSSSSSTAFGRASQINAISRIGLRSRLYLLRKLNTPSSNLREKYYSREILNALNQRNAVIETINMVASDNFDPLKLLLALDAFCLERPCTDGPSSIDTYKPLFTKVKKELMRLKAFISNINTKCAKLNSFGNLAGSGGGNTATAAEHDTIRHDFVFAVQKLGRILYRFNLLNDISDSELDPKNLSGLFLYGIFSNDRERPSMSFIAGIIYHYFATWIGLNASIVASDFDVYIRIEDPITTVSGAAPTTAKAPKSTSTATEDHKLNDQSFESLCIFADVNRAGKVRSIEEVQEILRLCQCRHTSLKPSPPSLIIDTFMRHLTSQYSLNQDPSRLSLSSASSASSILSFTSTSSLSSSSEATAMFCFGVTILSFALLVGQQDKEIVKELIPRESNNSRNLEQAIKSNNLYLMHSLYNQSNNVQSRKTKYLNAAEIMQTYTTAASVILNHTPCSLNLLCDFLFLVPDTLIPKSEKEIALEAVVGQLQNTLPPTTNHKHTHSSQPFPKYHLGTAVYTQRSWKFGVVIGWTYVSQTRGWRSLSYSHGTNGGSSNGSNGNGPNGHTSSRSVNQVPPTLRSFSHYNGTKPTPGSNYSGNNAAAAAAATTTTVWQVQYVVWQSSNGIVKVLESSLMPINFSFIPQAAIESGLSALSIVSQNTVYPLNQSDSHTSNRFWDSNESSNSQEISSPEDKPESPQSPLSNFGKLVSLEPNFFGSSVGKYFISFDEQLQLFVPSQELLDEYVEEREFFSSSK